MEMTARAAGTWHYDETVPLYLIHYSLSIFFFFNLFTVICKCATIKKKKTEAHTEITLTERRFYS